MRIENIKINGIYRPMGYLMESIRLSCVVKDAKGKEVALVNVEVSDREDFSNILFRVEGKLDTACIPLELETLPRTRYFARVTVIDDAADTATGETWFETGKQDVI